MFTRPSIAAATALALLGLATALGPVAQAQPADAPGRSTAPTEPAFDIYQFVVSGNSVLESLAIELAVTPFMGERRSLRDVEAARAALEKRYHADGWLSVVVSIPAQAVDGGEVALQVVEGTVDRLRVKGAQYTLPSALKDRVPEVAEGSVPNFNRLQREVAALNRNPDARVTPVLKAGALPGTVEVQLDVDDRPSLHGSVELNNRQTPNTTATRLSGSLRYDNLWQRGHSLGLTLQTAPQRSTDARVAALNYLLPFGPGGEALSFYAVESRSAFASLANAPGLSLLGNSNTFGLRMTLPLATDAQATQTFAGGFDFKQIRESLTVADTGQDNGRPITYLPLVASYNANVFGEQRTTTLELTTTVGLNGLSANRDAAFQAKRAGAKASFVSLRGGLSISEQIGPSTLVGRLNAQVATGPLLPTELIQAGGADSVRGYLEGERSGDLGLRGSLEWRAPAWTPAGPGAAWRLVPLGFVDAAVLRTVQPVAPAPARHSLASVGLGLRLTAPEGLTLDLDVARALLAGDATAAQSTRLHARALWGF